MRLILVLISLVMSTASIAMVHDPRAIEADPASAEGPIAPTLAGLGDHSVKVTTSVPESQYFFNQGLRLTYGFNHSEALRSFKEAVRLDPQNAMAYWGWALVLGPNLNLPMQEYVTEQAFAALQEAVALKDQVTDQEAAYIDALAKRYAPVAPDDRSSLDMAYAQAMRQLAEAYPDDDDAQTLTAAALMNLSPWNYWRLDGVPLQHTPELLRRLETVLARSPSHPGALHYYIHAVEAMHPARGEAAADRLAGLMPGAGHMVHMPSHIYMRLGRYADSYEANRLASLADESYIAQCKAQGLYPLGYYPHNLHFMVWSAMFQGRSEEALAGARKVQAQVPQDPDGNTWGAYETFMAQPLYVMVRFGMWDQLLAEPEPHERNLFVRGVWHYARGTAYANSGKSRNARRELRALERLHGSIGDTYLIGFGTAPKLLSIATNLLRADIAMLQGEKALAVSHASRAVRLEDSLLYNEPPDWYFPTRHVLGWALLEAGYPEEAEVVYWQDLRKNPDNGFALRGLLDVRKSQNVGTDQMEAAFKAAWADADRALRSSRF